MPSSPSPPRPARARAVASSGLSRSPHSRTEGIGLPHSVKITCRGAAAPALSSHAMESRRGCLGADWRGPRQGVRSHAQVEEVRQPQPDVVAHVDVLQAAPAAGRVSGTCSEDEASYDGRQQTELGRGAHDLMLQLAGVVLFPARPAADRIEKRGTDWTRCACPRGAGSGRVRSPQCRQGGWFSGARHRAREAALEQLCCSASLGGAGTVEGAHGLRGRPIPAGVFFSLSLRLSGGGRWDSSERLKSLPSAQDSHTVSSTLGLCNELGRCELAPFVMPPRGGSVVGASLITSRGSSCPASKISCTPPAATVCSLGWLAVEIQRSGSSWIRSGGGGL